MVATIDTVAGLGAELLAAAASGRPVAPLSARHPELTVADAYAIQDHQLAERLRAGHRVVGYTVGLTSAAMQRQLGIDSPDSGHVLDDMLYPAVGGSSALEPASRFIAPRVEPEFAFLLGSELVGPGVTIEDAAGAVASVHAAIEVIDSRIVDRRIALIDTVADNASCGAIVVGAESLDVDVRALAGVECTLVVDGDVRATGAGSAVMGDPLAPLAWLANTLAERGRALRAGETVLPGAFVAASPVGGGRTARADFGPLGGVSVTFTG